MDPSEMSRGSHARLGEDRELRPRSGVGMGGDAMRESLRDAPVYRPTRADMADFAAYVSRITPEVIAEYGICKIVPPHAYPHESAICSSGSLPESAPASSITQFSI